MNSSATSKPFWKKPMGIALIIIAIIAILAIIGNQLPETNEQATPSASATTEHPEAWRDGYQDITADAQTVDDRITDAYTFNSMDGTRPLHAITNADSEDYEIGKEVCEALTAEYPEPKIIIYDKDGAIIAERKAGQTCE